MREFGFEMRLCASLESDGELVARQLGASPHGTRVVDIVVVDPGESFDARRRLTDATIPAGLLEADTATGRASRPRDVIDASPEHRRELIARGVDCGFLTRERHNGQTRVRQAARYPDDWFAGLLAVENKPDLSTPGDLTLQLRKDVSLALFDRVVVATMSHVTGVHLHRFPSEIGVWRVDPATGDREVIREASPLPADEPGIDILADRPGRTDVRPVDAPTKARYRRRIAERAYGKGWRVPFPDCEHVTDLAVAGVDGIPFCRAKDRIVGPTDPCDGTSGTQASAEAVDVVARRAEHSPWRRDPAGPRRQQTGLDRFG